MRPLSRRFFARPPEEVAPALLGKLLVHDSPEGTTVGRIVETEAYDEADAASHSYRGRTARNEVMFGPPGHAYVYFSYGVHWCMNVVTGARGHGAAVLLRALEPLAGLELMAARRALGLDARSVLRLCRGPGSLAQAMGITRQHNGVDLVHGALRVMRDGARLPEASVARGPRVGISKARDVPWRFFVATSRYVSATRGSRP